MILLKNIKKITILISFSLLLMITPNITYGDCGLDIQNTQLDFGDLEVNEESSKLSIGFQKSGSDDAKISFSSTPWRDTDSRNIMAMGTTHYSFNQNTQYNNMDVVQASVPDIKIIKLNNLVISMYLQVLVKWLSPIESIGGFYGQVTQELTFTVACIPSS